VLLALASPTGSCLPYDVAPPSLHPHKLSLIRAHNVRCLANKRPMHHLRCQPLSEGPPCISDLITESILASSNYSL
jgi:hypothetical protein